MGQGGQSSSSATASGVCGGQSWSKLQSLFGNLSCFLGPPGAPKARRRLKQRQICGRNHLPWAYQTRAYSGIKVCGWLHAGPLSRQHQSLHLGSVETELSQGAGAKGTLPPSSLLSAPGLEEETGFSVLHSEVLGGLGSIVKHFETHLELIFEVLARVGSVQSLGFCVWRRIPHKCGCVGPGPQESVWRIYISLGCVPSVPHTARGCHMGAPPVSP